MIYFLEYDSHVQQLSITLHVFIYALRVIPGGNQVDGLPPASSPDDNFDENVFFPKIYQKMKFTIILKWCKKLSVYRNPWRDKGSNFGFGILTFKMTLIFENNPNIQNII